LVSFVFVFMKVGLENETYPSSYGGYQSLYNRGSNSIQQQQTTYITGYQASSQVPIPVEYSNFVELGEFVNAVTLIRMHREQQMQQQQNENRRIRRRRRLEEEEEKEEEKKEDDTEDDTEGAKENAQDVKEEDAEDKADDETKDGEDSKSKEDSADELDNVVDKAWEKAIQKNPEMEKHQQKANLLKVHHVPFFWHSEYYQFVSEVHVILSTQCIFHSMYLIMLIFQSYIQSY